MERSTDGHGEIVREPATNGVNVAASTPREPTETTTKNEQTFREHADSIHDSEDHAEEEGDVDEEDRGEMNRHGDDEGLTEIADVVETDEEAVNEARDQHEEA